MGLRRDSRKLAVKVLYVIEVFGATSDEAWDIVGYGDLSEKALGFARNLVDGTLAHLDLIDGTIKKYTMNWETERIASVDKAIIRMGLYEINYEDAIPRNASINEAVELAKYYSTSKSHKFVNGILDAGSREKVS